MWKKINKEMWVSFRKVLMPRSSFWKAGVNITTWALEQLLGCWGYLCPRDPFKGRK